MNNKLLLFFLTMLITGLASCDGGRLFEEYQGMETKSWLVSDTVSFYPPPTSSGAVPMISIKYNTDYPYRNLYLKYILTDSSENFSETQLINIRLFDSKTGKPTGKGYGSSYTRIDTLPFQMRGDYSKVQFIQYMRIDRLEGIEAIGFRQNKLEASAH
ncbi:gliding motility lipoprotein GldH [Belliella kenyensis]|uniref:Gliding motility lipoprotein GldH n=1 Tax=Belliella kenyensis TaxID=1472724 RepID=A0ABV8EI63_9BACT|nr:gliding motility lipoprotein GldH [Belliella kenyensis]MCH7401077.1 gliding motility lipoprotein GldH [Belliella kenyensis]MDN3604075.1 gliding motility lipoprotein GldH [Belliella kenyensis]